MILETVLSTKSIAHLQLEKENCKPLFFCDGIPFSFLKRRNDGRKQKKNPANYMCVQRQTGDFVFVLKCHSRLFTVLLYCNQGR